MSIFSVLGLTSGLISIVMYLPYGRDVIMRRAQPERASWLIWSALASIAFATQFAAHATDSLWMTIAQGIGTISIFLLSLKFGVGGWTKRDIIGLAIAGFGLVLWFFTKQPAYALSLAIFVDGVGTALTTYKAYKDPASETLTLWILGAMTGILGALTAGRIDFMLLGWPVYTVFANLAIVVAIAAGRARA